MKPTRRDLFKSVGALIVSFSFRPLHGQPSVPPPFDVDAFIAIHADGSVTLSTSKVDPGTGLTTAYRQLAAEELRIPVDRFHVVQGDTFTTPNHGGTGGSTGIPRGGADVRRAAATARRAILELGSSKLNQPAASLTLAEGQVRPLAGGPGVAIAALIGGRHFNLKVDPAVPLKKPADFQVIGQPILRTDLPFKATGRLPYVQDHSIPGMLYGRVVRPPAIGARLLSVDESSVSHLPGVRVIRVENFLGVVAEDEWAAIRAARELKASWSTETPAFRTDSFHSTLASAPVERSQTVVEQGDATPNPAHKQLSATFYWPFHGHTSLGPSCALANVQSGSTTVWSSTQDTYGLRNLVARTFRFAPEKVHVIYMDGSGSYGSNGAFDCACDAVLLSRAVNRPVRLQWMRHDEHGWDPKGPAQLIELRASLDDRGNIAAWESKATGSTGPQWTETLLGPTAAGIEPPTPRPGATPTTQNLDPPYAIPNLRVTSHAIANTPIRLSNLRAPLKIGNVFAVESFVDELAAAANEDPVAFRRKGLSDPRALAVIDRAAHMIGWQPRASAARTGTGRGFAYVRYKNAENYVAIAMEVAADRTTGRILVRRIVCAHDCGLIVNPDGLRNQVEGNILHSLSRSLHEEIAFERGHVTSSDWASYPILRFPEAPAVEVALIDRPNRPSWGAGEAAGAPVTAALANAVFDATGVRLRRVPFTTANFLAAVKS
ncbi:MAG: xanthine dehydrogenase family protein molybdopterin-binding subunit [Acidobacteriota bacterium]|nr:xanthine dehydrogenase family protein molybdopterin-binding subunit [Acidobacteriota bacterium]